MWPRMCLLLPASLCSSLSMQGEFQERRQTPRTDRKHVVRIRPFDPQFPPEYCTTFNISEAGLYFTTSVRHYMPGMNVYVRVIFSTGESDEPLGHRQCRASRGTREREVQCRDPNLCGPIR